MRKSHFSEESDASPPLCASSGSVEASGNSTALGLKGVFAQIFVSRLDMMRDDTVCLSSAVRMECA